MASLSFVLSPESCAKLHDALVCLAKFSDSVSIEARPRQLILSALNISKSAYVAFILDEHGFFHDYEFVSDHQKRNDKLGCRIYNKALQSVFKGRLIDPKDRETAIDRCEVTIPSQKDNPECRFIVKMVCKHGKDDYSSSESVTKTYKLTYESIDMMHALFNKEQATSRWQINARVLREFIEYFGPKTEQLDFYYEDGKMTLTSYTEKITNGREVLKQPLQTAVMIDTFDFEEFNVTESQHVAISVKDFKNMVIHAETMRTTVTAMYSQPTRPLQFRYEADGMACEYTLMTIGDFRSSVTPAVSRAATGEATAQVEGQRGQSTIMPPPQVPQGNRVSRQARPLGSRPPTQPPSFVSQHSEDGMFVPTDGDEQYWDPTEERQDEEDMLEWHASADNDAGLHATFQDSNIASGLRDNNGIHAGAQSSLAATQRASLVRGLFD